MRGFPVRGLLFLTLAAGCALESVFLFLFCTGRSFQLLMAAHLAGTGLFLAAYRIHALGIQSVKTIDSRHLLAILLVAFFPGLGWLAALLFYGAARSRLRQPAEPVDDEFSGEGKESFAESYEEDESFSHLLRRVRTEISFEPMVDILRGRETKTKSRAIVLLSRQISKENVGLLREALRDGAPEIRLYAASALLKMETALNLKIQKAKSRVEQRGSEADFAELGDLYKHYAEIGITDEVLSKFYLELAVEAYRSSLDIVTEQLDVTLRYARCLTALREFRKVKQLLDRAVEIWPRSRDVIFLRNEVYFNLGQYGDIGKFFSQIDGEALTDSQRRIREFWTASL
jgi:tetratricopeptide (TPR) repeat protein